MTPRKDRNPDAITLTVAARMLELGKARVARLRREGLLTHLPSIPTYSRADVEVFIDNPWLNGAKQHTYSASATIGSPN